MKYRLSLGVYFKDRLKTTPTDANENFSWDKSLFNCFWNSKIRVTDVAILLLDAVSVLVVLKIDRPFSLT